MASHLKKNVGVLTILCLLKMDSQRCISYVANLKWSHYLVLQPNKHLGDARWGTNRHKDSPVGQLSAHLLVEGILMKNISLNICTGGSRLVVCWMILLCTYITPIKLWVTQLHLFRDLKKTWLEFPTMTDDLVSCNKKSANQSTDSYREIFHRHKKKCSKPEGPVANKNRPWSIIAWDLNEGMLIKGGRLASRAWSRNDAWYVGSDEEVS